MLKPKHTYPFSLPHRKRYALRAPKLRHLPSRRFARLLVLIPIFLALWFLIPFRRDSLIASFSPPDKKLGPTTYTGTDMTPLHETKEEPEFEFHSPYRREADVQFERRLESALRTLAKETREAEGVKAGKGLGAGDRWPKIIWQAWLLRPASWYQRRAEGKGLTIGREREKIISKEKSMAEKKLLYMDEWKSTNPDYKFHLMTDTTADHFVSTYFASIPEIVHVYRMLPQPVLRADFLRYLLLFAYGGVWADHDIRPRRPLSECPFPMRDSDAPATHPSTTLIVGTEIDEPYVTLRTRKMWHWSRIYGFAQYHMIAKRFSPMTRTAVVRVVAHAYMHGKWMGEGRDMVWGLRMVVGWWRKLWHMSGGIYTNTYAEQEVLEISGPGLWTDAVLDSLSKAIVARNRTAKEGTVGTVGNLGTSRVTWETFTGLKTPREFVIEWKTPKVSDERSKLAVEEGEDVGVFALPINYWGNGQRHSGADHFGTAQACANHMFQRTWKRGWWEWAFG